MFSLADHTYYGVQLLSTRGCYLSQRHRPCSAIYGGPPKLPPSVMTRAERTRSSAITSIHAYHPCMKPSLSIVPCYLVGYSTLVNRVFKRLFLETTPIDRSIKQNSSVYKQNNMSYPMKTISMNQTIYISQIEVQSRSKQTVLSPKTHEQLSVKHNTHTQYPSQKQTILSYKTEQ